MRSPAASPAGPSVPSQSSQAHLELPQQPLQLGGMRRQQRHARGVLRVHADGKGGDDVEGTPAWGGLVTSSVISLAKLD